MRPYAYKTRRFSVNRWGYVNPDPVGTDAARRTLFPSARAEPAATPPTRCPSVPSRVGNP
jgi:hypothetical protein